MSVVQRSTDDPKSMTKIELTDPTVLRGGEWIILSGPLLKKRKKKSGRASRQRSQQGKGKAVDVALGEKLKLELGSDDQVSTR
eukprot:scaffold2664_cov267-Pinguiococcus_pyrenoidosus.AAC.11